MSEPKFTPGPWIAESGVTGTQPDRGCGVIASDSDVSISNPSRGIVAWAAQRVGRTNDETLANANLIAATIDLLAALRKARRYIKPEHEILDDVCLLAEIDAAIAKAEGRT